MQYAYIIKIIKVNYLHVLLVRTKKHKRLHSTVSSLSDLAHSSSSSVGSKDVVRLGRPVSSQV